LLAASGILHLQWRPDRRWLCPGTLHEDGLVITFRRLAITFPGTAEKLIGISSKWYRHHPAIVIDIFPSFGFTIAITSER